MLASPQTYLSLSLKKGNFERSRDVYNRFSFDHKAQELISVAEKMHNLYSTGKIEFLGMYSLEPLIAITDSIQQFHIWLDAALILNAKPQEIMQLLDKAEKIFTKQQNGKTVPLFARLRYLLKSFENLPLISIVNQLHDFPKNLQELQKFLTNLERKTEKLKLLVSGVNSGNSLLFQN